MCSFTLGQHLSHGVAVGMDRAGELMVGTHYRENLGERVTGGGWGGERLE